MQRGIESYVVHMDVGDVVIESPVNEMRIAALYRGNAPREGGDTPLESFDEFLQGMAALAAMQGLPGALRAEAPPAWAIGFEGVQGDLPREWLPEVGRQVSKRCLVVEPILEQAVTQTAEAQRRVVAVRRRVVS